MRTRRGTKYVHEGHYVPRSKSTGSTPKRDGRPACQWVMPGNWMRPGRRCVSAISGRLRNWSAFTNSRLSSCDAEIGSTSAYLQESLVRLKLASL